MDNNYIEKLEFDYIRENLSTLCTFYLSKKLCKNIKPEFDSKKINNMHLKTQEAREFLEKENQVLFSNINNIVPLEIEIKEGHTLQALEIIEINEFLKQCDNLKTSLSLSKERFKNLNNLANKISNTNDLIISIENSIDEKGKIKNTASKDLKILRKKTSEKYKLLNKFLTKIISDRSKENYFQSSSIRTISGRLALEIKSEYKSKIKGIIHGSSSTNQTVYIEPIGSIDLCNNWIETNSEVKKEEEKILAVLTKKIIEKQENIKVNGKLITEIDLFFAKAKLSKQMNGSKLNNIHSGELNLVDCRHPILKSDAKPISIKMEKGISTIVISGPNTGGKTVALKTIGLISLIYQSGIQPPCSPDSQIPIFKDFFVHIGDDQNLKKSESSFSSHISSLINTINNASEESLIIVDEIVSSTDPDEGNALACAILNYLNTISSKSFISTHIKGIIEYAKQENWCENYSVSFDQKKNIPTYELKKGVPSSSFAINISKKLGIPENIIKNAEKMLDSDYLSYKNLISELEKNKLKISIREKEIEKELKKIKEKEKEIEKELKKIKEKEKEIISETKIKQASKVRELEKELKKIKDISNNPSQIKLNKKELKKIKKAISLQDEINSDITLEIGEYVRLDGLSEIGRVSKVKSKKLALFKVGRSIIEMPISSVISKVKIDKSSPRLISYKSELKAISTEIDLIGIQISDVKEELEKYLDSSIINNQKICKIIHGEGSGVLKSEVIRVLDDSPIINKYYPHKDRKGVTIAEII